MWYGEVTTATECHPHRFASPEANPASSTVLPTGPTTRIRSLGTPFDTFRDTKEWPKRFWDKKPIGIKGYDTAKR